MFIRDDSDLGYSYIDEIDDERTSKLVTHDDLIAIAMNYYFEHINILTEEEMKQIIGKELYEKANNEHTI